MSWGRTASGSWTPTASTSTSPWRPTSPPPPPIKTEIGKQEVRVGKSDYILKSQYIEFKDTQIIDVEWLDEAQG